MTPADSTALEDGTNGEVYGTERGKAEEIDGWMEYTRGGGPERDIRRQTAVGVAFGYKTALKDGTMVVSPGASLSQRPAAIGLRAGGPNLVPGGVGDDFYTLTKPDSVSGWEQRRGRLGPYVWVPLDDRFTLKCSLSYVDRRLEWRDDTGEFLQCPPALETLRRHLDHGTRHRVTLFLLAVADRKIRRLSVTAFGVQLQPVV